MDTELVSLNRAAFIFDLGVRVRAVDADFEELFLSSYDSLVASVTVITGSREVAQDSVQEAFIKASGNWRKLQKYDNPAAWIRRVAINHSFDIKKSQTRRLAREEKLAQSNSYKPDDLTARSETLELQKIISQLSERQKEVVVLYYLEDFSIKEIAKTLKLSKGTVKFHLSESRKKLKELILVNEGSEEPVVDLDLTECNNKIRFAGEQKQQSGIVNNQMRQP